MYKKGLKAIVKRRFMVKKSNGFTLSKKLLENPRPHQKNKWSVPNVKKSNLQSIPPYMYLLYQVQQQHFKDGLIL